MCTDQNSRPPFPAIKNWNNTRKVITNIVRIIWIKHSERHSMERKKKSKRGRNVYGIRQKKSQYIMFRDLSHMFQVTSSSKAIKCNIQIYAFNRTNIHTTPPLPEPSHPNTTRGSLKRIIRYNLLPRFCNLNKGKLGDQNKSSLISSFQTNKT